MDLEAENVELLQKKLRELDVVLEQCQRGAIIPSAHLPYHPALDVPTSRANATTIKGHLEKYNVSQVDQYLTDLGLTTVIGSTAESREEFANELNKYAKSWPIEISKQTKLAESSFPGSIEKEIGFWKEMEKKLAETRENLDSVPIALTKLILRRTNRVSEQLIREAEIDLDKCHEIVQTSVQFVRDFPIDDVLSASDLHPKLSKAVNTGLQHFAKLKHSKYDFNRALQVLEVFCAAIFTRMVALLKEKNMLLCDMDELCRIKRQTDEVLIIWETQLITQRSMLKDVAKRRNEKMRPLNLQYESLQQRLNAVFQFRENHQRLVNVFTEVLSGQESDLTAELNEAYRIVLRVENDLFDVSTAGASAWLSALDLYERRLERVESRVTRLLEGRLNNCKTAEDMFRVFAIFNPLFFRPAIRNAVNSFRTLLVKNVREDVHRLQNKFRLRYDDSLEKTTADLRDIPPLSGQIIWAKQIDNQLSTLMQRMADVLGADWGDHFEGKQLKEVCEELKSYLTTDQLYSEWLSQQLAKSDTNKFSKSRDFLLLVETDPKTNHKVLVVNFDQKQVTVFKEVRYLEWLLPTMNTAHKTIPHTVRNQAKEAFTRYPVAMALQAALSGYAHAKSGINATNQSLLVNHLQAVREAVKEAIGGNKRSKRWIKWDSVELNEWVSQLSSKVYTLQERVDDLNEKLQSTDHLLSQLYSCPYDRKTMDGIIEKMQIIVDEMQTRGFSNILVWVNDLDKRTESVILSRLKAAIQLWSRSFLHNSTSFAVAADSTDSHVDGADAVVEEVLLPLDQTVYEILLSNQILYLSPPLDQARVEWISSFHQFIGIAASLSRIVSSRLHVFAKTSTGPKDFSDVLQQVDSTIMRSAFDAIEVRIQQAYEYVAQWLQYQTLWDASVSEIADRLGREIPKWCQLLSDIKASRATIETADDEKSFGPLVINHRQVQNKVNLKYDTWQKDSQQRFGAILSEEIRALYSELSTCKSKLEAIYLEGPTKDVISGVEYILKTKSTITAKKEQVELLENSEKVLQRQRFQFPKEWLAATTLVSAFTDMSQILDKRSSSMDMQLPTLQIKIKEEDRLLLSRTDELSSNWERDRPADGNAVPSEVLQSLSMFASQVSKLYEDATRLQGAKKALGMDFLNDNRLGFITQEVADLREAWGSVTPFHDKLRDIRTVLLRDSNPIKVRKQLEEILNELRNLPAKIRSYSPIECLQDRIGKYMNIQPVLRDVCTEALKDRHWKVILQGLGIHTLFSELNLGSFWDANPLPHRKLITDVLGTAQGELALEQFLRDLREFWLGCELTLVMRDNIRLVTGWDVLFSTLEDNLNSLAALKQSPYFRNVPEFQEDTMSWEGRLTSLRVIFDFWVEVQRKWVYLRGIFRNPDIKAQLPAQYSKFKSIDSEFIGLLKRIATKPSVMELLQIDNLSRQLERQDAGMIVIQKALGDYLEKQRQIFPRFYFVNNDDLVEIIGNVNEPGKIVPHLSKMFSAINSLEFHTDGGDVVSSSTSDDSVALTKQSVVAMCSKEGERVALTTSISLAQGIKEWLGQLERGMVVTLATLLQKASASASEIKDSELLGWMSEYPNQVVILAMQVLWTRNCENALKSKSSAIEELKTLLAALDSRLKSLSESVLGSMEASLRKKCEHLLTEMVHQRDVVRQLIAGKVTSNQDFKWLYHLRFYLDTKEVEPTKQLTVCMSNASFFYGFEYLGIGDRLVQTPLTDRCYLTLTQALHFRMGGNPFGPAGKLLLYYYITILFIKYDKSSHSYLV